MRKIVSILLACVLSLGILVGCKKQEPIETVEVDRTMLLNITADEFKERWNGLKDNKDAQIGEWEITEQEYGTDYCFKFPSEIYLTVTADNEAKNGEARTILVEARSEESQKLFDEYAERFIRCCSALDKKQLEKAKEDLQTSNPEYRDHMKDDWWKLYLAGDHLYNCYASAYYGPEKWLIELWAYSDIYDDFITGELEK